MRVFLLMLIFLSCFLSSLLANVLHPNEAFKINSNYDEQGVFLKFTLGKDIFLYKKELKIFLNQNDISKDLNLPNPQLEGKDEVFYSPLELALTKLYLKDKKIDNARLEIYYQGCSKNGFCYRPMKASFDLEYTQDLYTISPANENHKNNILENKNFYISLVSFFGYGLLLSLTPCTLPMIPILSSLILAKNTGKNTKVRTLWLSFIFVFFMSLAYALAGIITALAGASVQGFLQKPLVLSFFALIFVLLALACFGVFKLQMPSFIQNFITKINLGKGTLSVAIMGFLSALIVGPCVAAPLAAALLYIASSGDLILGGAALFVLSLGMGVPLLFVGLGLGFLKSGAWMQKINLIFGFLMLAMSIWILSRFIQTQYILMAFGILGVFFVSFLGLFDKTENNLQRAYKAILTLILSYSLALFLGGLFGGKSYINPLSFNNASKSAQNLNQNKLNFRLINDLNELKALISSSSKPIMLYFTASWCENCKLLENFVYSDERIQNKLKAYELVKIDISESKDKELELMRAYQVFAPPVLLFFENQELKERIDGYLNADALLEKL